VSSPSPARDLASRKIALKEAQSGATLALWLVPLGMVQMCCAGVPMGELELPQWQTVLSIVAMVSSLLGALVALPPRALLAIGVGGSKGGMRYANFEARIAAGTAARPTVLPRIFIVGAAAAALLALSQSLVFLSTLPRARLLWPLSAASAIFAIIAGLSVAWYVRAYRNHAGALRRLPPPPEPPPGALPAGGSLESMALWFSRASRQACMLGTLAGALWVIGVVFSLIFSEELASLAGIPLAAVTTYSCMRAYKGLHVFVRGRDPHVLGALMWGVLGGVAGTTPPAVFWVLQLGLQAGWWAHDPDALPALMRYGLAQPMGVCLSPFIATLGVCGFTLVVFGRELTTKKSHEDRESEQSHFGGL
jgi:hypothetical protein